MSDHDEQLTVDEELDTRTFGQWVTDLDPGPQPLEPDDQDDE